MVNEATPAKIGQVDVTLTELTEAFTKLRELVDTASLECIGNGDLEQGALALYNVRQAATTLEVTFKKSFPLPDPFAVIMEFAERRDSTYVRPVDKRFKAFDVGKRLAYADPRFGHPGTYPDIPENRNLKYRHHATSWVSFCLNHLVEMGYLEQTNSGMFYKFVRHYDPSEGKAFALRCLMSVQA